MERDLTIAEAARTFAEVVNRAERGESTRLAKAGRVVVRIVPVGETPLYKTGTELARAWNDLNRPRLTPAEASEFETDLRVASPSLLPPREDLWE